MKILTITLITLALASSSCRGQQPKSVDDPALVAAVDSLMPRLEKLSGLKKLKPISMKHQSRDDLRKYVADRLKEEMPPEEFKGIKAAYSAFGLIADTVDLEKLLLDLYTEQVAGYYDPKTDTFYMVEGTPRELLRPTLAHELVHALQDQHADLDSLISRKRGNDRQTAAQAAIEGHATLVMFAILADPTGNFDVSMLPDMGAQLRPVMEAQNSQFPVFQSAPRIIRETMLFPYVTGAGFVQALWRAQRNSADRFAAPLGARLPQSTEQVMDVASRYLTTRDHPTELQFKQPPPGKLLYENTLGALEMTILLDQHLGNPAAATGWDGDRFRVVDVDGKPVLFWQTVWDDAAAADRFAEAYRSVARKRGDRAIRVQRNDVGQMPGVWVTDAPSGVDVSRFGPLLVQVRG